MPHVKKARRDDILHCNKLFTELLKIGLDKQIKYADKKGIPLIIIAGPDEIANQQVKLRRLADGTERMAGFDGVVATVRDLLAL